ncbi:phosphoribosylformylglycinamidine synthase [Clostridium aminobutyricum]|uniref:Phosphoribosylformylglycinamidine synthase n=1 Tax=Clostridium aminobutyricum TaxID=33953 RepID=A0A939IIY6_CLOAM|nr:phosphoribosylformylglycinamidine synthase [Clostridium aminobutyricum]MBN7773053.1 phosphoribosylformylglycinamidine synthase [Clostridium aminobutyricum]
MVKRIYVEKKQGFNIEAKGLYEDLKQNLHLEGLTNVRVINRYDVEGVDETTYENSKYTVFAEPAIDVVYEEELPNGLGENLFAVGYLPGQYDQRADSAAQCIKMMNAEVNAVVKFTRIIALEGEVSTEQFAAVKHYCINPVDSQETSMEKPENLKLESVVPDDVTLVKGFINMAEEKLEAFRKEMGFAMSAKDILFIQEYFKKEEKRDPSITELRVVDTYWSDHCRHTTFMTKLTDIRFEEGEYTQVIQEAFEEYLEMRQEVYGERAQKSSEEGGKDICLMDLACIGAKYLKKKGLVEDLDESEEINACSIKVKAKIDGREEDWLVMFKNETHNHPTEIEPFGGAATCLGGAIRDPLSGRVYVYQAMRVTGSADPRTPIEETLPGKLPQRKITQGAAAGYSSYGNQIGLATGQVVEIYDKDYVAKRMEIGAVIGAAPASHVRRESPIESDCIVLVGGRTGRDGCGGATGSSKEHTEDSILTCGAEVQKGNPPVERNIQRLFRRKEVSTLIKRCNDFGAGGVSVAIGELADSLDVNLDLVLKKYDGLDGTELAISESQERMAVVVDKADAEQFIAYAQQENLEAVVVAKVTDTGRFRMYWREKCILDLSRAFLNTNGATQEATVFVKNNVDITTLDDGSIKKITRHLEDLNCCSQKGLVERFDSTIGAATVLMPLGGKHQLSPAAGMAAKLPVTEGETTTATLMTYGFDPQIAKFSPYHGAMYAVIDSVTKIVAMGGDYTKVRLSFQEYFERMTENPESWSKPFSALLGALKVQKELNIPAIGGKDSMSGTFMDINVPPTLVSFAVSVADAEEVVSTELKRKDSQLVFLAPKWNKDKIIDFDMYRKSMARVRELTAQKKILSANTVGRGGIFISLVKMAVGNKVGVGLDYVSERELHEQYYGALILEISKDENAEELFDGLRHKVIGHTDDREEIAIQITDDNKKPIGVALGLSIDELIRQWSAPLESIFPVRTADWKTTIDQTVVPTISYEGKCTYTPAIKIAKPRVLIPTFPGTNCEVDSKRAFERAGAETDIQLIRNMTQHQLIDSINELEQKIRQSQIIFIPGGFSGGDEPDGSAKFITAVFRNPAIKEAVTDLLENRDGLMFGICNGFQALIKLGLVPCGKILDLDEKAPTLTYNKIGRHASCLVRTRISSVKSPWLAGTQVGELHTVAISHGEGRFIANEEVLNQLIAGGQVATQYVGFNGTPSMDIKFNPNYSTMAIEGITSPDGRVFGKMGHSERIGQYVYKNIQGNTDQKIFESGVKYFK